MGQERKLRLGPDRLRLPRGASPHTRRHRLPETKCPYERYKYQKVEHPTLPPNSTQVCVQMDSQFLANSATMDGNDLSSVVGHGEHWCVCAWAFASAVDRDPTSIEGLQLMCDESNSKLREVYQHYIDEGEGLTGPTGNSYGPTEALAAVNRLCPEPSAGWDVIAQSGLMAS